MDIKEYISSGILESYVLDAVSPQEKQEVECMSHIYPEINEELVRLQDTMESLADFLATDPPKELKNRVLQAIEDVEQLSADSEEKESETIVRTMVPAAWRGLVAASVVLAVVFGGMWFSTRQQAGSLKNDLAAAERSLEELETNQDELNQNVESLQALVAQQATINKNIGDPSTQNIALLGTDVSPESKVRVFWNPDNETVLLKVDDLPAPGDDLQYQLWAIVDGVPQDMGVFELDSASQEIQLMPYNVSTAQAFAITLEQAGGSPTPNLANLYVIGNV
ncbi:MAG: anti-sigma factor [Flavobacteriales bacterium]|nr:anti-sigma factor [Flavobacteriales bacterium]